MLMPNGVIKLIDFGCAKRLCINLSMSQTQILKSMRGTPYWMAPEVVTETGHGKKSDIWYAVIFLLDVKGNITIQRKMCVS